ncbi:MAG TPA: hypothetical protein VIY29_05585 [Ktedonobacteraceae bacterium]
MSVSRTLWQMQLATIRNSARYEAHARFAFVLVTFFDITLGYWSGSQLMAHIEQWKTVGPLAVYAGLWSICLLTWVGMGLVATLELVQQGLGNDVSLLLFTLPLAPASRFRAQFGMFFMSRLWNWLLLETSITGAVFLLTLGWPQALLWLMLLQLGVACAVYGTMVIVMLVIRNILPYNWAKARIALWSILALMLALAIALTVYPQWGTSIVNAMASMARSISGLGAGFEGWLKPEFACLLFALMLLIALGPLAGWAGDLYAAAFLVTQGWDRSRNAMQFPGVRVISRLTARRRTLTGALLVKGLLGQSRNFLFWGRFVIIVAALAFFQPVRTLITSHGFSDAIFAIGYASAVALLATLEQAPNALSGEGNRLSLYLTAPFSSADMLRAKLMTFLFPTMVVGLATDLFLSWRIGLPLAITVYSAVAVVLIIVGCIALPVLGSMWEENLNLPIEGTIQIIFQEEVAISLKRLLLVYLSLVLCAVSLLMLWKLPPMLALAALLLLDIAVLTVMLHWSKMYLRRLLRVG